VLERAKQQRAVNGAPPLPKWLEESVSEAPAEIEREKRRGIERFGKQYEIGDDQAIFALQQTTIQLQCSLLMKITNVEDHTTDFKALARAADQGRDGTISTLMALRRRLGQAEIEGGLSSLRISTELPPPPPMITTDAREMVMSPVSHGDTLLGPANVQRDSVLSHRVSSLSVPKSVSEHRESVVSRNDTLSPASSHSSAQRRSSTTASVHSQAQSFHFNQAPEPARAQSVSLAAQPARTNIPSSSLIELPKPTRKNNYLGFCKCAWRLQTGDEKAFVKSKDWTQRSASSTAYSLACDRFKCEFKSPYKSAGNPSVIWNKLVVDDKHGIKYRWSFLAKSHVTQKNVVNEDYSYQCQFCVFSGLQVPVMNLTMLLEHISVEHRKQPISDVILHETGCINDKIAKDGEKFDINLYPAMPGVEADAFISPVVGDLRDPLMRPVHPVEKYGKPSVPRPNVFELYA
jgi:hypothetical protein